MRLPTALLAASLFAVFSSGCASYSESMVEVRDLYLAGRYDQAAATLEESKLGEQSRNRLLYLLEKASINDKLGKRSDSRKLYIDADKLATRLFTTSVSKEALTYLYNDTAQDYAGEDYEQVAIHSQLALSFIQDDQLNSARVEARRINTKLDEINGRYDEKSKNRYRDDAYASYLSGAIYEANGEFDDAIIDYRKALATYSDVYGSLLGVAMPKQLVQALANLYVRRDRKDDLRKLKTNFAAVEIPKVSDVKTSGQLLLLVDRGLISRKQTNEFLLPFGSQIIRLSFPIIYARNQVSSFRVSIRIPGKDLSADAEILENFDQIAAKTLDDRRTRLILKQGARLLAKGQLTEQARMNFGPVAGIAANVYSAVSEVADTRSWMLLPAAVYGIRTVVSPGSYKFDVVEEGRVLGHCELTVKPGGLSLCRLSKNK